MADEPHPTGHYASPPCFMHEDADGAPTQGGTGNWDDVKRWRRAERQRLVDARRALSIEERTQMARQIGKGLDAVISAIDGRTVSLYWPFRGEPDLRPWLASVWERGGQTALPVVIEKGQPLIFRSYRPGDALERGVWNIPVPAGGQEIIPDIVISPLVGFDAENFRLGYGGGFFDRTLATLPRKPLTIGIGYAFSRLATIYPQPHDIPMDRIVTELSA